MKRKKQILSFQKKVKQSKTHKLDISQEVCGFMGNILEMQRDLRS